MWLTRPGRAVTAPIVKLSAVSALAICGLLACAPARAAEFSIVDQRGSGEISEQTRFYIDGALVAHAELGERQNQTVMQVTVPDRAQYEYSLCGTVTIRGPAGAETHEVNASGVLRHPDGHRFEAMGTENYTGFYLIDRTDPLSGSVENRAIRSTACATPSS